MPNIIMKSCRSMSIKFMNNTPIMNPGILLSVLHVLLMENNVKIGKNSLISYLTAVGTTSRLINDTVDTTAPIDAITKHIVTI